MAQTHLRLVDGTFMDKSKALNAVLSQIGCAFGHDSIIGRGNSEGTGFATIETSEPEAALFALAEQVDLAEKAFHNALVCRNEAQIAYLRDPSIMTLEALEKSKTAEAVALDILDTEIRRLASTRATTVIGLKLKASYASTGDKLADSIVGEPYCQAPAITQGCIIFAPVRDPMTLAGNVASAFRLKLERHDPLPP